MRPFTLLEILICLTLLGCAAVFVGWNLKGVYETHKLESTAQQLLSKLRECETLSLSYQIDIEMEIVQQEQGIAYKISTDEPLIGYSKALVVLNDQCRFTFNHQPIHSLKLHIGPTGWVEPRGMIGIQRLDKEEKLWIDLGHTPQIKLSRTKPVHSHKILPEYPGSI